MARSAFAKEIENLRQKIRMDLRHLLEHYRYDPEGEHKNEQTIIFPIVLQMADQAGVSEEQCLAGTNFKPKDLEAWKVIVALPSAEKQSVVFNNIRHSLRIAQSPIPA